MSPAFETVEAAKDCQLKEALEATGVDVHKDDTLFYEVQKKEEVSGKKHVVLLKDGSLLLDDAARKRVGLPPGGGAEGHIAPSDVPAGYLCFVQSTSHNRKVHAGANVLLLRKDDSASSGAKRKADEDASAPGPKKHKKHADGEDIVASLLEKFKRYGEVGKPTAGGKVPAGVPDEIKEMMLAASDWHLQKDSSGVFGVNFFDAETGFIKKVQLFGDESCMEDWRKDHPSPNTAEKGWECIVAVSEYDFIFCNVDSTSKHFGSTRINTNNCGDDKPLTDAPFSKFLSKVDTFATKWLKYRDEHKDDEDWADEAPGFSNWLKGFD